MSDSDLHARPQEVSGRYAEPTDVRADVSRQICQAECLKLATCAGISHDGTWFAVLCSLAVLWADSNGPPSGCVAEVVIAIYGRRNATSRLFRRATTHSCLSASSMCLAAALGIDKHQCCGGRAAALRQQVPEGGPPGLQQPM